jgi:hypothetical protein
MSASMYARRPPEAQATGVRVDYQVHRMISRRLFDHDGTVSGVVFVRNGDADHHYMIGVRDALTVGSDEYKSLGIILEMIEHHGGVELEISR